MTLREVSGKIRKKISDYKAAQAEKRRLEKERQQNILEGRINPIRISVKLNPGERAFFCAMADRWANVEHIVQTTTGKSKRKHVITRGIVGGVLLGPVGALAGAATAGAAKNQKTIQKTVSKQEKVDSGKFILTDQRVLFIGDDELLDLPYDEIIATEAYGSTICFKYANMQPGESFCVTGELAKDTELYFKGITEHLLNS